MKQFLGLGFAATASVLCSTAFAETLEDVPCKHCLLAIPSGTTEKMPLLVALHGDNGTIYQRTLFNAWKTACEKSHVVLFAPRCPVEAGCNHASYWQWYVSPSHDPAWLGEQID